MNLRRSWFALISILLAGPLLWAAIRQVQRGEEALSLLHNGRIDITPLLTHRFTLSEFSQALEIFEQRKDGAMKVAIKPN